MTPIDLLILSLYLTLIVGQRNHRRSLGHQSYNLHQAINERTSTTVSLDEIHRSAEKPDLFHLKYLDNSRIRCNDGSRAGYYYRSSRTNNADSWIIYLEGGWYCHDSESCKLRSQNNQLLTSSRWWPLTRKINGILSQNLTVNPNYSHFNQIYLPYCSSDLWTGDNDKRFNDEFHFHGHRIIRSVVRELLNFSHFRHVKKLVISGSSAGGIGVMMNIDRIAYRVKQSIRDPLIMVSGIVESAWYLEKKPYVDSSPSYFSICGNNDCDIDKAMNSAIKTWRPKIPGKCAFLLRDQVWKCFYGKYLIPLLKSKIFVIQSLFDEVQLQLINAPLLSGGNMEKLAYIQETGQNVSDSLRDLEGVFATSCTDHQILLNDDWILARIQDFYLQDTLRKWDLTLPRLEYLSSVRKHKNRRFNPTTGKDETLEFLSRLISIMNYRMFSYMRRPQQQRWRFRRDLRFTKDDFGPLNIVDRCNDDSSLAACSFPLFPVCSGYCLSQPSQFMHFRLSPVNILRLYGANVSQLAEESQTNLDMLQGLSNQDQLKTIFCTKLV